MRSQLANLSQILNAQMLHTPVSLAIEEAVGVSTDTRTVRPGEIFVALRGDRFDGHDFLTVAQERGAIALVVDRNFTGLDQGVWDPNASPQPCAILQVQDTLAAYQRLGQWWRDQFQIPIIGITGSVGKTTTKELVAAVVGTQGSVLKTQANYNNEIGVPKTLLALNASHRYGVIEMAMRGPGEIALLTQLARPTIGIITNVGVAHIERLGSRQAIAQAKCELLAEMPPGGVAVLNQDNDLLMATAATVWSGETVTFGFSGGAVQGQLEDLTTLRVGKHRFQLPLPGEHNASNFLAALAVAQILQIDWDVLRAIAVELPGGRCRTYSLAPDIVLLDETYNAGPESMLAALKLLAQTPGQRHIAVLGTMKELGERSLQFHREVGQGVQHLHLDYLFILAEEGEGLALAQGAGSVPTERFSTQAELGARLQTFLQAGDRVLFKASRSVALDQVVDQICRVLTASGVTASGVTPPEVMPPGIAPPGVMLPEVMAAPD